MTHVFEVMTRGVRTLSPQDSLASAARAMDELDVGVVPVCEGERLVGMVTDRDLVVRGIAHGWPPEDTRLAEVMSRDPQWCFEDQTLDEVLERMRDARIRRVPVLDHAEHLVGMLSLGDVAVKADGDGAGIVLQEVSEPAAPADAAAGEVEVRRAGNLDEGDGRRADDRAWANAGVVPRPNAKTVWVLVADEAVAKILRRREGGGELEPVEALTDPAAHGREADFHRDAAGRRAGPAPPGSRQNTPHRLRGSASLTASAGEDDLHLEAQGFARRVAQHLTEALRQKRFDELRIVAAPRFLGHLRKEMDPQLSAAVTDELDKDFVHYGPGELTRRLFPGPGHTPPE
jgi:CBS domain-containing protein/protein required for attachment to host cells